MKRIVFVIAAFLAAVLPVWAENTAKENDFDRIAQEAVSFFMPISGKVVSVNDGGAVIDIGSTEEVKGGMRLKVFREESDFKHPVTGEALGKIEAETGDVEVIAPAEKQSTVKVISGNLKAGDRVRISSGTIRLLFYQTRSVEWAAGDSLYRSFKHAGRFDVIETAHDGDDTTVMLSDMKEKGAVLGVFVKEKELMGKKALQIGFYHPDGTLFNSRELPLSDEQLKQLRSGYDFLKETGPRNSSFEVSSSTDLIATCDFGEKDKSELVSVTGREIVISKIDDAVTPVSTGKTGRHDEVLRLDCGKVDDGTPVIAVSAMLSNRISSEVFRREGNTLKKIYETEGFLRILDGKLLYQAYSDDVGFSGGIFAVETGKEAWKPGSRMRIPEGINLYDFTPVGIEGKEGNLVINNYASLTLYDESWMALWKAEEKLGGFIREFGRTSLSGLVDNGKWYGKDRVLPYGGSWILIKRHPVAENVPGLGFSSTDFIAVTIAGKSATESTVLKDVGGTVLDFAVLDDRLVVLVKPSITAKAGNIFKGKSPFNRNLYLFPLRKD